MSLDTLVSGSATGTFKHCRLLSCTSPDYFRANIDACLKKTLETKPQLIQISAAWNSCGGALLGRNQYVELEINEGWVPSLAQGREGPSHS